VIIQNGASVKVMNNPPMTGWNTEGYMDYLKGRTVVIAEVISGDKFFVRNENPIVRSSYLWSINLDDIEGVFAGEVLLPPTGRTTHVCANCGVDMPEGSEYSDLVGNAICEDCYNAEFFTCSECGEVHLQSEMVETRDGDLVCNTCYEEHYFTCSGCEEVVHDSHQWASDGDTTICEGCADDYFICPDCDNIYPIDSAVDISGEHYCSSCARTHRPTFIREHNYKPSPRFLGHGTNGYYGVELEIDAPSGVRYDTLSDTAQFITESTSGNVYCKSDGSLANGFEMVTHPATLAYHMAEMDWESLTSEARRNKFKSHETSTCGLHIHASRTLFGANKAEQDLNIAKIMLLFDRFWDSHIIAFSRRNIDRISRWACKPDGRFIETDSEDILVRKAINTSDRGRYQAVNLQNRNTVEFRIFRGTLKTSTLLASIQWVDTLINYVRDIKLKDMWKVTWEDMFNGTQYQELSEYLVNRGITGSIVGRAIEDSDSN